MADILRIAEFTKYPGPRYRSDGPFSAQEFRHEHLEPRLRAASERGECLEVVLDGVSGYGSSFLEESFGGLVRSGFSEKQLNQNLRIIAETTRFEHHRLRALQYIRDALKKSTERPRTLAG